MNSETAVMCQFSLTSTKPDSRDITETVTTLARLARFIIADITDPKSIPLELQSIVPDVAVPVQPLTVAIRRIVGVQQVPRSKKEIPLGP